MRTTRNTWLTIAATCLVASLPWPGHASGHAGRIHVLQAPSTVHGYVGGEAHDSYEYHARKGERLVVRVDWRTEGANAAEFMVSGDKAFDSAEQLAYGTWSQDEHAWTGTLQDGGNLYIHVVAHPSAHYTLTIRRQAGPSIAPPATAADR